MVNIFFEPFCQHVFDNHGTPFVILYVFVLSCFCYVFVHDCLYVLCGHLLGKG